MNNYYKDNEFLYLMKLMKLTNEMFIFGNGTMNFFEPISGKNFVLQHRSYNNMNSNYLGSVSVQYEDEVGMMELLLVEYKKGSVLDRYSTHNSWNVGNTMSIILYDAYEAYNDFPFGRDNHSMIELSKCFNSTDMEEAKFKYDIQSSIGDSDEYLLACKINSQRSLLSYDGNYRIFLQKEVLFENVWKALLASHDAGIIRYRGVVSTADSLELLVE